jgi:AbrB family looped-hinge helix DNA binding protein
MTYFTAVTQKGQITIPKKIRDIFGLTRTDKVSVSFSRGEKVIKVKPVKDFVKVAEQIIIKKKTSPLLTREMMEKKYERG